MSPAIALTVKIDTITLPARHRRLDADGLRHRVEHELADLLAREPLRSSPPRDARIAIPGARVQAATAEHVAYAIARRIHSDLQTRERRS